MFSRILFTFILATLSVFAGVSNCAAALASSGSVFLRAEPGSYVGGGIGSPTVLWTHGREGIFSIKPEL